MKLFINKTSELKTYLSDVNISKSDASVLPAISDAQHQYIMPEIGSDLYSSLMEKINADQKGGNKIDKETADLLEQIRKPLAWFTYYNLLKGGVIQIGDAGIAETNNEQTNPVRQWVLNSALENAIQKADMYLDNLLLFLETNADKYSIWKKSVAYTQSSSLFINSTDEFQEHEDIGGSRRLFKIIRYRIKEVEASHIMPILGERLFQQMKEFYKNYKNKDIPENLTHNSKLITYIQSALATQALLQSLSRININISFQGLTFVRSDNGIVRKEGKFIDESGHYQWFATELKVQAEAKMKQLLNFVLTNQDKFPEFRNSKYYVQPSNKRETNTNLKGIFVG